MGHSQPEMRTMSHFKIPKPRLLGLLVCTLIPGIAPAQQLILALDKYAYQFDSDVIIDFNNEIIDFDSNMINCLQPNAQAPLDTSVFALSTNLQIIGLKKVIYNVEQGVIYFTSETADLVCTNGIFIDLIYNNGFE